MRAYPIWNEVRACIYKTSRSWGARERAEVRVNVGTSAKYSNHFLTHSTTHRKHEDGTREYRFFVDDVLVKVATLSKDRKDFSTRWVEELPEVVTANRKES